jgi:MoxR-like ATPase
MAGRYAVGFEDVRTVARAALRHRIHRSFEAEAEGITTDEIARRVVRLTPTAAPELAAKPSTATKPSATRTGGAR